MASRSIHIMAFGLIFSLFSGPVLAAKCGNTSKGFSHWVVQFKKEARKKGIKKRTLRRTLRGVKYDHSVIKKDRNQKHFKLSFSKFYKLRVSPGGLAKGRTMMRRHRKLLRRVYKRYGVQPRIITAIWSLETFYGGFTGDKPIFRSLATLSYDCRRSKMFTQNLYAALRVVQRGDMNPKKMKGAWAGELGQTQFMAKNYYRYAVDFDGDGKRNLIRSKADALASTANLLRAHGWKRGGCYRPGCANFRVLHHWNRSKVYQRTIAKMASQL
ncbi:MAG: lytic murein transglycosylase [Hyphomicrobiaceae bacterium]|nr:lytic murein transglycosylase [Hyphomicrobiaceae bacterium]